MGVDSCQLGGSRIAYDEILSEFAERKRGIQESGVEVKMGPTPCVSMSSCIYRALSSDQSDWPSRPGNPLAVFILDFLYWPHDKVSQEVGYLDTSILTYRNLGQYGFYDTIRSGQGRSRISRIACLRPQADARCSRR